MSQIKLAPNASGTGIFTIDSPNSNTNRTLTLPDATGTIITTAGGAAISGTTGTFTGLVDISAAGAGQIKFPATQNASSNANTLDDYEEGTWTPTANNVTVNSGSPTYSGVYTKVGNIVYVQMYQSGGNITLANNTFFGGLPFNVATNNTSPGGWSCVGTNKSGVQYVYDNTANLYVVAGISTLTNLTGFIASAVYKV
jgi:hypothetical protein